MKPKSRGQTPKLKEDIPDKLQRAWILSGVLRPLCRQTRVRRWQQWSSARTRSETVLPRAAVPSKLASENATQESQKPEGPIKRRCTRNTHTYSLGAGRETTGHAQLQGFLPSDSNAIQPVGSSTSWSTLMKYYISSHRCCCFRGLSLMFVQIKHPLEMYTNMY